MEEKRKIGDKEERNVREREKEIINLRLKIKNNKKNRDMRQSKRIN